MFFKNAIAYTINTPIDLTVGELSEKLEAGKFEPCGSHQPHSMGFVPPCGQNFAHRIDGFIAICLKVQSKVLPNAAINEALNDRIEAIMTTRAGKISRKERKDIKDDLTVSMLPKAFTTSAKTYAYIDIKRQIIVVDAAAATKAEALLSCLREALGTLAVKPLSADNSPSKVLTDWALYESCPAGFDALNDYNLIDPSDSGNKVTCKGHDISSED